MRLYSEILALKIFFIPPQKPANTKRLFEGHEISKSGTIPRCQQS